MLRDTDVGLCVVTALALCLIKKTPRCFKQWYEQRPQNVLTNLVTDLQMSEPNDYSFTLCDSTIHHLMGYSSMLPLELLKKYSHSRSIRRLSITLRYLTI
jgi:hypothetical protein